MVDIHAYIHKSATQRTEAAEPVIGEECTIRSAECHHRFRSVHHRSRVKTQLMTFESKEATISYQILLAGYTIEAFDRSESLLITSNYNVGIVLFNQLDRT